MLSPEGACRPFDARAAGYVRGEGVACVLVKRAADAVRDGDRIWAVIKGGAVRHSGRTNSLTAPNPDAQADVIVAAVADAGIDPLSIGYVEAHGTGTSLGDPIEVEWAQAGLPPVARRAWPYRGGSAFHRRQREGADRPPGGGGWIGRVAQDRARARPPRDPWQPVSH